jgi:hypothetical protein
VPSQEAATSAVPVQAWRSAWAGSRGAEHWHEGESRASGGVYAAGTSHRCFRRGNMDHSVQVRGTCVTTQGSHLPRSGIVAGGCESLRNQWISAHTWLKLDASCGCTCRLQQHLLSAAASCCRLLQPAEDDGHRRPCQRKRLCACLCASRVPEPARCAAAAIARPVVLLCSQAAGTLFCLTAPPRRQKVFLHLAGRRCSCCGSPAPACSADQAAHGRRPRSP